MDTIEALDELVKLEVVAGQIRGGGQTVEILGVERGGVIRAVERVVSIAPGVTPVTRTAVFEIVRRNRRPMCVVCEQGLTLRELAADGFATSVHRPVVTATGEAGTVYLCHPFLVHAAQPHHGERPRFLAQPPLLPVDPENRPRGELNALELATARALERLP
jgi:hypothetical protein